MENNITLLVGLKNNLDYTKHFYDTTRELYPQVGICFVSYGSTDGTHEWLDSLKDPQVRYYYSTESKTFSDTFNKAAELATTEYVAYLHNDIVLAPKFLENIQKHLREDRIVSYTTIEPPIFAGHERPGKIIHDLGTTIDQFSKHQLFEFSNLKQDQFRDQTEPGIVFFMCIPRKVLLEVGGMDNLFNPMFCEDDDLIKRFKLLGLDMITSLDAICYHFVSKTSRFSEEYQNKTQQIEFNSNKNFIRKWGSRSSDVKYSVGYIVQNCNMNVLAATEPWCDNIYIEDENLCSDYIAVEQVNTKYNLKDRVRTYNFNDEDKPNNIIVEFDGSKLTNENFQLLQQLPQIIKETSELGQFEIDIFKITIKDLTEYQNNLIHIYK